MTAEPAVGEHPHGEPRWRPRQRWRSLRVRALAVVLAVALSPLVLVAGASVIERGVDTRMRERVGLAAREARIALEQAAAKGQPAAGVRARADRIAESYGVRLRVLDSTGAVVFDIDHESRGTGLLRAIFFSLDGAPTLAEFDRTLSDVGAREELRGLAPGERSVGCRASDGAKLLVCHAAAATTSGAWRIYVQESSRRAIRALYDMRYQLVKLTLVLLPTALLLAWWLGWRMVRPVEHLRRQVMRKVASAAPAPDIELNRGDELGDLATAFNTLLARLHERAKANEAFAADVAHEFKNPVAAIRACAESLDAGGVDEARAERLARVLHDSSTRLDALLTQLLELARVEAGLAGEERSRIKLGELLEGVVGTARADERWANLGFVAEAEPDAVLDGVATRLESALRNLVENAASYASAEVRTRVRRVGGELVVEVQDDGPGISAADLPRIFDRFFTTRAQERGSGLGLAMVRAVAEAHGGTVEVTSTPDEGACFTLRVPG